MKKPLIHLITNYVTVNDVVNMILACGGMLAWPLAKYVMGADAAFFAYVVPFLVSTMGGTIIAAILIAILSKTKALAYLKGLLTQ